MEDLLNNIKIVRAMDHQTISTNTTTAGDIIDLQGFNSCTFVFSMGTLTDGDYVPLIEDGDAANLSDNAAVADGDLIGTETGADFLADTDDNDMSKIGYKGNKRYVRLSIVSTNTSSGATLGAVCILGHPRNAPYSTQVTTD